MKYSVIIPTFNSQRYILNTIHSIRSACRNCEIIISDGGSFDQTREIVLKEDVLLVSSKKGRGTQLMEGFRKSTGEYFLFLHADTVVSQNAFDALDHWFEKKSMLAGKFSLSFDRAHWLLTFYAQMAKIDSFWTSFGDQGIAVKRSFFEEIGGFPDWPLLEDVQFFQKARKKTKIYTLPMHVMTSAERFIRNGFIKQQVLNGIILIKYLLGYSVKELSLQYEKR